MNKDIQKMSLDEFIDYLRQPKKKPSFKYRFWKFYYANRNLVIIILLTIVQIILATIHIDFCE